MASLFSVQSTLKTFLLNKTDVLTVTFGDVDEMDLDRKASYPLAHLDHENTRVLDHVKEFDFTAYIAEPLVEFSTPDSFGSTNNINFIYNTLDNLVETLNFHLRKGELADGLMRIVGNVDVEPFRERFENALVGYAVTFTVEVPKDYINV